MGKSVILKIFITKGLETDLNKKIEISITNSDRLPLNPPGLEIDLINDSGSTTPSPPPKPKNLSLGLCHLVIKLYLPSTNRSKKQPMGFLALYMLHRRWKSHANEFASFLKDAAIQTAGKFDGSDSDESEEDEPVCDRDSPNVYSSNSVNGRDSDSPEDNVVPRCNSTTTSEDSDSEKEGKDVKSSYSASASEDSDSENEEKKLIVGLIQRAFRRILILK